MKKIENIQSVAVGSIISNDDWIVAGYDNFCVIA